MKQSPVYDRIEAAMRPGAITRDGFLGADTRRLSEILDADAGDVKRLGFSHQALAARMRALRDAAAAGLGEPIDVGEHLEVRVDAARGRLPCPFGDCGLHEKTFVVARNRRTGRELTYSDLNIHLIERHGFYEGLGAAFRVAPADIVAVLEPEPDPREGA